MIMQLIQVKQERKHLPREQLSEPRGTSNGSGASSTSTGWPFSTWFWPNNMSSYVIEEWNEMECIFLMNE